MRKGTLVTWGLRISKVSAQPFKWTRDVVVCLNFFRCPIFCKKTECAVLPEPLLFACATREYLLSHGRTRINFAGDDKTLFVKNLAETVTEDTLRDFFSPAEIDEIRLPKKRDGGCKG